MMIRRRLKKMYEENFDDRTGSDGVFYVAQQLNKPSKEQHFYKKEQPAHESSWAHIRLILS
jgi:hypothetical protein